MTGRKKDEQGLMEYSGGEAHVRPVAAVRQWELKLLQKASDNCDKIVRAIDFL